MHLASLKFFISSFLSYQDKHFMQFTLHLQSAWASNEDVIDSFLCTVPKGIFALNVWLRPLLDIIKLIPDLS